MFCVGYSRYTKTVEKYYPKSIVADIASDKKIIMYINLITNNILI